MPKVNTKDLTGPALNWAVGKVLSKDPSNSQVRWYCWELIGNIIEEYNITLVRAEDECSGNTF